MELKKMLLASIEAHGKCDIYGIYKLYPHFRKFSILRALFELRNEGWIKVKKTRVEDEIKVKCPNVLRTKKQLYEQIQMQF